MIAVPPTKYTALGIQGNTVAPTASYLGNKHAFQRRYESRLKFVDAVIVAKLPGGAG